MEPLVHAKLHALSSFINLTYCSVKSERNLTHLKYKAGVTRRLYLKVKKETKLFTFTFTKEKGLDIWTRKVENPGVMERRGRAGHFHVNGLYVLFKDTYVMSFSSRFWTYRRKYSMPKAFKRLSSLHLPYHLFNLSQVSSILVRSWYFTEERELNILDTGAEKNSIWKLLFLTVTLILHPGRVRVQDLAAVSCYAKRTPAVHTESDLSSS